jgi:hypothetical protein
MAVATSTAILSAAALSAATAAGTSYFASREQANALREAGDFEQAYQFELLALQQELLELEKQLISESEPVRLAAFAALEQLIPVYREATETGIGELTEVATADPGTSQFFKTGLEEGVNQLMANLAKFGLTESTVQERETGTLTGSLLTAEEQNRLFASQVLAGQGAQITAPTTPTVSPLLSNVLGARTEGVGDIASLIAAEGGQRGGLFDTAGGLFAQLPLLLALYGGGSPSPTTPTTTAANTSFLV